MRVRFLALPACWDGEREQCAGTASESWRRIKGAHDAIRIRPTASRYRDPGRNCRRRLRRVGWQVVRLGPLGLAFFEPRSTRYRNGS